MKTQKLVCLKCGLISEDDQIQCQKCKGYYSSLSVNYQYKKLNNISELYTSFLPFDLFSESDFVNCPLEKYTSGIFIKDEGSNNSGSVKEKELFIGVKSAQFLGFKNLICVSGGSGINAASYIANKFSIPLSIFSPQTTKKTLANQIILGKEYEDTYKKILDKNYSSANITPGANPYSQEGGKVISWQIIVKVKDFDAIIVPIGNGSLIWGIYKGFKEAKLSGLIKKIPKMIGVQLDNSLIARSLVSGKTEINQRIIGSKATSIDVKESFCLEKAICAINQSKGEMIIVTDKMIEEISTNFQKSYPKHHNFAANSTLAAAKLIIGKYSKICCIITAK